MPVFRRNPSHHFSYSFALLTAVFLAVALTVTALPAQETRPETSRAAQMMKARQYRSAIKLLEGLGTHSGRELLMMGEAYYQLKEYATSPHLVQPCPDSR